MSLDEAKEILERFEIGMSATALVDADSVGAASLRAKQCEIRSEAILTVLIALESFTPAHQPADNVLPTVEDAKQWKRENSGYYISPELENEVAKYMSDYAMEVLARSGYFDGRDSKGE